MVIRCDDDIGVTETTVIPPGNDSRWTFLMAMVNLVAAVASPAKMVRKLLMIFWVDVV